MNSATLFGIAVSIAVALPMALVCLAIWKTTKEEERSKTKTIVMGLDFSPTPTGRYIKDSPCSGEAFRERVLIPAMKKYEKVKVDLAGTEGYGASFLEEAFGGLVRTGIFTPAEISKKLSITSSDRKMEAFSFYAQVYLDDELEFFMMDENARKNIEEKESCAYCTPKKMNKSVYKDEYRSVLIPFLLRTGTEMVFDDKQWRIEDKNGSIAINYCPVCGRELKERRL